MAFSAPEVQSGGVSSFGYSGTIAHAVLAFGQGEVREVLAFGQAADSSEVLGFGRWVADQAGGPVLAKCSEIEEGRSAFPPLTYRRRAFPWRDATSSVVIANTLMYSMCWAPVMFPSTSSPPSSLLVTTQTLFCKADSGAVGLASWQTLSLIHI